ncbi:MAG: hypothetical protein N3A66_05825, partial [Planctomycetota bacterium]|nr:hypothetical protein [Planctomycetota bacterium]
MKRQPAGQTVKAKAQTKQKPIVYFASVAVKRPEADATLPAKLERLLRHFHLEKWCAKERVPIKLHLGGEVGYTTIPPRLVRVVVERGGSASAPTVVVAVIDNGPGVPPAQRAAIFEKFRQGTQEAVS